jgi:hypothetical protein
VESNAKEMCLGLDIAQNTRHHTVHNVSVLGAHNLYGTQHTMPKRENEKVGRWLVGVAENHGDRLCFWVLTNNKEELIVQGYLRKRRDEENQNPVLKKVAGTLMEKDDEKIKSRNEKFNTPLYHADQIKENGTILIEPGANKARLVHTHTPTSGEDERLIIIQPEDIISKLINIDGKQKGTIRERLNESEYKIEYKNGKQDVLTYNEIIEALNKHDDEGVD